MSSRKLILIVEDDPDTRFVFGAILNHDGYRVVDAGDGRLGVQLAADRLPDLILMDIAMPVMDGFEAARRIRATEGLEDVPVLAITGNLFAEGEQEELDRLFDGHLVKPVAPRTVLCEAQRLIGPPEDSSP